MVGFLACDCSSGWSLGALCESPGLAVLQTSPGSWIRCVPQELSDPGEEVSLCSRARDLIVGGEYPISLGLSGNNSTAQSEEKKVMDTRKSRWWKGIILKTN